MPPTYSYAASPRSPLAVTVAVAVPFLRDVGTVEGAAVIFADGDGEMNVRQVGFAEGALVGRLVEVGRRVGRRFGRLEGFRVGKMVVGSSEGAKLGSSVGKAGLLVGRRV